MCETGKGPCGSLVTADCGGRQNCEECTSINLCPPRKAGYPYDTNRYCTVPVAVVPRDFPSSALARVPSLPLEVGVDAPVDEHIPHGPWRPLKELPSFAALFLPSKSIRQVSPSAGWLEASSPRETEACLRKDLRTWLWSCSGLCSADLYSVSTRHNLLSSMKSTMRSQSAWEDKRADEVRPPHPSPRGV